MMQTAISAGPRRMHSRWWTVVPALPGGPATQEAHALRRVWFDHTMNAFRPQPDGSLRGGARGFYIEGTEDHITPATFQTWSIMGEPQGWLNNLLSLFGIAAAGPIQAVRWCYLFEQYGQDGKRPIADIVVAWRDAESEAVLVVEAKRPGAKLAAKDLTDLQRYLRMPSIAAVRRRYLGLLVDDADMPRMKAELSGAWPVVSWQSLIAAQVRSAEALHAPTAILQEVTSLILEHAGHHGLIRSTRCAPLSIIRGEGTAISYAGIAETAASSEIVRFLLGSEAAIAARKGLNPTPPMPWLADARTAEEIWRAKVQTTAERQIARWRLGWKP